MPGEFRFEAADGVLLVTRADTGDIAATAYEGDDGWWTGRDVTGVARHLYPTPGVVPAEADIAERLTRPTQP